MNKSILKLNTKYIFGKNVVKTDLSNELKANNVATAMLLYGGGSIKRNNNLYSDIVSICKDANVKLVEFSGISPNPRDTECALAAKQIRENNVDLIIAAGGGSVIDASKVIGILATNKQYNDDAWKYVNEPKHVTNPATKIFSIITLAATGSENNYGSVITNATTLDKRAVMTPSGLPIVCFSDPTYTQSLTKWQTGCGIFDIFSHLLEQYYSPLANFEWNDNYNIANMKTLLSNAIKIEKNLNDYEARANMLWTSSFSLNDLSKFGSTGGDWKVHMMEHAISGLWDVAHGAGLALLTPTYIKYMCEHQQFFKERTLKLAQELFGVNTIDKFIDEILKIIRLYDLPEKWSDFDQINDVTQENIQWLVNHTKCCDIQETSEIIFNLIKK